MKEKYGWVAFLVLGMAAACTGGEQPEKNESVDSVQLAAKTEPMADSEQTAMVKVKLGGSDYEVSLHRFPDRKLPLVIDELEQQFYDNSVQVTVRRDGEAFFDRTFSKEAFAQFLSETDYKGGMLLGMNCDTARCDRSTLCFTAQVGQAGEGPAFLVLVPTNGGEVKVSRDNLQEEIGYK